MACLPMVERELRLALRKQQPAKDRFLVALCASLVTMLFLLVARVARMPQVGQLLERLLCMAGAYFVASAPRLAAGILARERENQTMGLLFLSGLSAWDVFAGKLLSAMLVASNRMLALFPLLALPFFLGGVSFPLFLAIVWVLPASMLFVVAVSMLASVCSRDHGGAVVLAFALCGVVCGFPPLLDAAQKNFSSAGTVSGAWLAMSPAYGPYLVWNGFNSGFHKVEQGEFWWNAGITLGWSILALVAAAWRLRLSWRDQEEPAEVRDRWQTRWQQFIHGDEAGRRTTARVWLEVNPFVWLVARDVQPARLAWLVLAALGGAWLIGCLLWTSRWLCIPNLIITGALFNAVLSWLQSHTAARSIAQPRVTGEYELILTTPLQTADLVRGVLEATASQLRRPALAVLLAQAVLMTLGWVIRSWQPAAIMEYLLVSSALVFWSWRLGHSWSRLVPVMWTSLNCGRPAQAVWRSSGFKAGSFIWLFFNLQLITRHIQRFPTGSIGECVVVGISFVFGSIWFAERYFRLARKVPELRWDPAAGQWVHGKFAILENRLAREFREIVREPIPEPTDARFKRWDPHERFPWGWQLAQQQLHERLVRHESAGGSA